jgi:uncharacterized protein (DUF1778 family)
MPASVTQHRRRPSLKSQRLMARISADQKRLLQRAADIRGQTLIEFVVSAAQEAATRAVVDREVIALSMRDSEAFAKGMIETPPIGASLRAAAQRYKKIMDL